MEINSRKMTRYIWPDDAKRLVAKALRVQDKKPHAALLHSQLEPAHRIQQCRLLEVFATSRNPTARLRHSQDVGSNHRRLRHGTWLRESCSEVRLLEEGSLQRNGATAACGRPLLWSVWTQSTETAVERQGRDTQALDQRRPSRSDPGDVR